MAETRGYETIGISREVYGCMVLGQGIEIASSEDESSDGSSTTLDDRENCCDSLNSWRIRHTDKRPDDLESSVTFNNLVGRDATRMGFSSTAGVGVVETTTASSAELDKNDGLNSAFGITYCSRTVSSREYQQPAGPTIVDEEEFERNMGAEFRVACNWPLAAANSTLRTSSPGGGQRPEGTGDFIVQNGTKQLHSTSNVPNVFSYPQARFSHSTPMGRAQLCQLCNAFVTRISL